MYSTKTINTINSRDFLKMYTLSYIIGKNGSAYGREILSNIRSKNGVWTPSHGSLYPLLEDMVENNLLVVDQEEGKRKYYKATRKGRHLYKKTSEDFINTLRVTSEFYSNIADDLTVIE